MKRLRRRAVQVKKKFIIGSGEALSVAVLGGYGISCLFCL